jgi:hypothetical protein
MHDPLAELPTNPRVPLPEPVLRARTAMRRAVSDLLAVPDAALEAPWRWRRTDPNDIDVRYGLYRLHEVLEEAVAAVSRLRATSDGVDAAGPAVAPLASSTAARWSLHGALVGLPASAWDADPGGGEWSIRRTIAHVISSQRAYGWTTAWFVDRAGTPDAGEYAPDGALPPEPDEASEADGDLPDVADRLDALVDQAAECLGSLDSAGLAAPGRWYGVPVTVDFRLGRLGSHLREHTIQVDKTVAMLGLSVSETVRLARLTLDTFGRLEALVFGRPAAGIADDLALIEASADAAAATAADVRATVGAGTG